MEPDTAQAHRCAFAERLYDDPVVLEDRIDEGSF